ncbi:MAG TPA: GAF domain-containing protein [Candidatus Acidoferrum sp.]|nr:GAF domain-containing protein [Candidatus Acidoferrum sp.]
MVESSSCEPKEAGELSCPARSVLEALRTIVLNKGSRKQRLRDAAQTLRQSGGYRWVGLYDVVPARGIVSCLVWDGPGAPQYPEFPMEKGLTGRSIRSGKTVNVGDVASDADYLTALESTKSEIILPIIGDEGLVVGTVDVESQFRNAFGPEAQALLEECAEVIRPLWDRAART